ncbi:MAG: hypothetical protein Q8R05_00825 [Candidatus Omnitrophota bacterium]|nr:hypothetical protein [Candidatus Omnitrophota bacterium]
MKFYEMQNVEEKTRDMYKYYIDRLKDEVLLKNFREIYADEVKHVGITRNFVEISSK